MTSRRHALALLGAGSLGLALRPLPSLGGGFLQTRDRQAGSLLSGALDGKGFWDGSSTKTYTGQLYDEVRLKALESGYLAMVTGEGGQDFQAEAVVRTIFEHMDRLPEVEDGAMAVVRLGTGTDAFNGLPYVDSFYYLDFTLFYGTYGQRMYKRIDGDRTVLYFEKLTPEIAGAAWSGYRAKMDQAAAAVDRRALFNTVREVSEIFGMFVVSPGSQRSTRVTFTTRVHFGEDSGLVARMGSEMPAVIKAGLRSGFDSCVAIARKVQAGG